MTTKKPFRITVRKQKSEGGLASISQTPRGVTIHLDGVKVAAVQGQRDRTYFWYTLSDADLGIERQNTCATPTTLEAAKDEAVAYIKGCVEKLKALETIGNAFEESTAQAVEAKFKPRKKG